MDGSKPPANRPQDSHIWTKAALGLAVLLVGFLGGALAIRLYDQNLAGEDDSGLNGIADQSEAISQAVEKIGPSVVSIQTETIERGGFFLDEIFRREGEGTGIIVSDDGLILTNRHVIPETVDQVNVVLADGTVYEDVGVVDRDPLNDIAFLRISQPGELKVAPLGDSSALQVGDQVLAIGNALGEFSNTVTSGIVSGLGRPIVAGDGAAAERLQNLIQTDAAINPGNSGGPLVNLAGEVIGVTTAVAGGAENIGFAIPIDDVKPILASVRETGEISRPFLGVRYITLTPAISDELELEEDQGAYILGGQGQPGVVPDSPADEAGLQAEDIITNVNGEDVNQQNPLASRLNTFSPGDNVVLTVIRDGEERTFEVTLGTLPED